ncbi:MAG: CPBP family intramembrane glutamic endopeptidase [Promethearchaeia archaeon]
MRKNKNYYFLDAESDYNPELINKNYKILLKPRKLNNITIEGNDIGIFMYFIALITIGILFSFSANPIIKHILDFYITFDLMALCFVFIQFSFFYKKYDGQDYNSGFSYKFLNFNEYSWSDFYKGLAYIGISFVLLLLVATFISFLPGANIYHGGIENFINSYNTNTLFLIQLRTIITEELVFRGLIFSVIFIFLNLILKFGENIAVITSVIASSLFFSLIHYFRYGNNLQAIIYLFFLGVFCAILTVKFGIWAGIFLHIINNFFAIYGGSLILYSIDLAFIILFGALIIFILVVFLIAKRILGNTFYFEYFSIFFILSFIIGFFTNGLIKSEDWGNLYFEHFHSILFVPAIMFFKNKFENSKLTSITLGAILGIFISDYFDIINMSLIELGYTLLYIAHFIMFYSIINLIIKRKKGKRGR